MGYLKNEIRKIRGVRQSILQRDGQKVLLPHPRGTAQAEVYTHEHACYLADAHRQPRPETTKWHRVMCNAADRLAAIRLFLTDYTPPADDDKMERHMGAPYCWDCLYREGRLVDASVAPADHSRDTRPIPHGKTEPIDWDDPHALFKEVA